MPSRKACGSPPTYSHAHSPAYGYTHSHTYTDSHSNPYADTHTHSQTYPRIAIKQ